MWVKQIANKSPISLINMYKSKVYLDITTVDPFPDKITFSTTHPWFKRSPKFDPFFPPLTSRLSLFGNRKTKVQASLIVQALSHGRPCAPLAENTSLQNVTRIPSVVKTLQWFMSTSPSPSSLRENEYQTKLNFHSMKIMASSVFLKIYFVLDDWKL